MMHAIAVKVAEIEEAAEEETAQAELAWRWKRV